MANDKNSHGPKASAKAETIHLKVFIHCEGCKKKVKRTLNSIEGVEAVDVDGELGKVTITSTMDSAVIIKKLEKAGKVAELIPNSVNGGKGKGQPKAEKQANGEKTRGGNFKEDEKNGDEDNGEFFEDASIKKPNGKHQEENNNDNGSDDNKNKNNRNSNNNNNNNNNNNSNNHNSNNGQGGKKKKGGGGGGGGEAGMNESYELGMNAGMPYYEVGMNAFHESGTNRNMASKNIAPIMVETAYSNSLESAEYATHMFSDENANNCAIM